MGKEGEKVLLLQSETVDWLFGLKSPIMSYVHTYAEHREGIPAQGRGSDCAYNYFGKVAPKRAETLLQSQESNKTSLDFLANPKPARLTGLR